MTVFWFRRDLRTFDNAGLYHALQKGNVLPIFIFDPNILSELPPDDARVTFIHDLLEKLNRQLRYGLAVFMGDPLKIFGQLSENHSITDVYCNSDYEPYAIQRDKAVAEMLASKGIVFHSFKDQVIFERDEIVKDDGSPYVVYTPYSKRWFERFTPDMTRAYPSADLLEHTVKHDYPFLSLADIGFERSAISVPDYDDSMQMMDRYSETRNFPAPDATSNLSPHLRFGSVSIRQMVGRAINHPDKTFVKELIWREFFMNILWHFPHTVTRSFRPEYDHIRWVNNKAHFEAWCNGMTGYPMVDAGMRQLLHTGRMSNRVRMVVASFLCKDLLIDWRWGEAWFAQKLLDYEQSSNVGNWQWAAGSGVDAAPYFRVFNPVEQQRKFDPDGEYVRRWIPELNSLDYPAPIVDHAQARIKCLEVYQVALKN